MLVACVEHLRRSFYLQELVLLKRALVRGVSETALRRSGFRKIVEMRSYVSPVRGDDEMLAAFHSSHRNDTRKALREGLRYTHELPADEYSALAALMKETTGYSGTEPAVVEAIERTLARAGRAFLSGVFEGERLSAASVVLHAGACAFYLYGASRRDKTRGATTYLQYENMRHLRTLGVSQYDFGGAGLADETDAKTVSITAFKERFGGAPIRCFGGSYR